MSGNLYSVEFYEMAGKRLFLSGGAGFLGSHVVERLRAARAGEVVVPLEVEHDLAGPQRRESRGIAAGEAHVGPFG